MDVAPPFSGGLHDVQRSTSGNLTHLVDQPDPRYDDAGQDGGGPVSRLRHGDLAYVSYCMAMQTELQGRTALVTGGSGIGLAIACRLVPKVNVVVTGRNPCISPLRQPSGEWAGSVETICADVLYTEIKGGGGGAAHSAASTSWSTTPVLASS
jgi:hypothetical protein